MGRWTDAARRKADAIKTAGGMLTDDQACKVPTLFMPWDAESNYKAGDRVLHGGLLYRCLQPHTAQVMWTPGAATSLWVRIDDPAEAWPAWKQPTGSTDAYVLGAWVTHKGKRWISTVAANTWEPGVYGWKEETT